MFAGIHWQPHAIERIHEVKGTSTKPLKAVTDAGVALIKYIGNPAGEDALISELIGSELANLVGLDTPAFAVVNIPRTEIDAVGSIAEAGPAFFSKWEQSFSLAPNSQILRNVRDTKKIVLLVIFDTWIRNKDRFCSDYNGQYENNNFDNILFIPDKRKTKLMVIDQTHAFAETGLEYELDDGWANEEIIFGLFDEFKPFLNRNDIEFALNAISRIDANTIESICQSTPKEWGMTSTLAKRLTECLIARGRNMQNWAMNSLLDQLELNLDGKEG
ncbi:HipA family kinase [Brucella pseudogrignonensis]|uniref:HipA family kinase n=1 Tax=Brucella pseudogrignonensis TaxID=419475 RepID=UPI000CFDA8AD|nr:HipA family kinase [Brucella pseudogrignonensis]MQP38625.1 hypothetical protein [Ochrobactrum sp. MYb237]PQZ43243.1 hypothetical protein CQ059_04720 [Brucella pseudogrignonensis]PRA42990.1 hypothetical protein CQ063_01205 [Brucella pseudogrignonensis]PRA72542.1 hypothetical protein CQ055_04375 [Brucella pseudogrignonensis]